MEINVSGLVAIIELQGRRARYVINTHTAVTRKGEREEEGWGPRAAVSSEVDGSHGEQWVMRGRLWESGCKHVDGQKLPNQRPARAPGKGDAALLCSCSLEVESIAAPPGEDCAGEEAWLPFR